MTDLPEFTEYQQTLLRSLFIESRRRIKNNTVNIYHLRRQAKAHMMSTNQYSTRKVELDELTTVGLIMIKPSVTGITIALTKEGGNIARLLVAFEDI